MGDIARVLGRRAEGVAAAFRAAISAPKRGAHSVDAARPVALRDKPARGAHSARNTAARTRGAHSTRDAATRTRGAHSARRQRTARHAAPFNPRLAPAAARGFSMAETLATVAILVILFAIVAINVIAFQANLRQKELDAKAEIIYVAAQEQMTRIMASGRESIFAAPNKDNTENYEPPAAEGGYSFLKTRSGVSFIPAIEAIPGDSVPDGSTESPIAKWQTCYISSADLGTPGSASNTLFGQGGLDDELLNNHWIIEYDSKSLIVHGVFYSEDFDCAAAVNITDPEDPAAGYAYGGSNFEKYNFQLRNRTERLNAGGYLGAGRHVGYHGGSSASTGVSYSLEPSVQITNAEKLVATIKCTKPLLDKDLAFLVTLQDSFGNVNKAYYVMDADYANFTGSAEGIPVYDQTTKPAPNASLSNNGGLVYTLKLTLDSLEEGGAADPQALRFTKLYGSMSPAADPANTSGNKPLVEGSDISIKVKVLCKGSTLVEAGYAGYTPWDTTTFNSLFDDANSAAAASTRVSTVGGTGSIAGISCGRHLQNLDESSGVNAGRWRQSEWSIPYFTKAYQDASIDFDRGSGASGDAGYTGWTSTYGAAGQRSYFNGTASDGTFKPCFQPIANSKLTSFSGKPSAAALEAAPFSIAHLHVDESGKANSSAGLFASAKGLSLDNVMLTGARIAGSTVGGLVGTNSGTLTINNCQVYLDPFKDPPRPNDDPAPWFRGATVGGLVGVSSASASLKITSSSASTVANASGTVGGLVGVNAATLKINTSYADCYLKGSSVGGILGSGSATIEHSYAAGYLGGTDTSSTAAGLVNGSGSSISDSYTVCATYGKELYSYYWMAQQSTGLTNVHYLASEVKATNVEDKDESKQFTDKNPATDLLGWLNGTSTDPFFTLDQQSSSAPYNLMDQGLVSYDWPSIKGLPHYGDWAAGFLSGSLVYFEKYRIFDESGHSRGECYGFTGANVSSTLVDAAVIGEKGGPSHLWQREGTTWKKLAPTSNEKLSIVVVGDGYGVVYKEDAPRSAEVTVTVPGEEQPLNARIDIDPEHCYHVKSPKDAFAGEGVNYRLFPLDLETTSGSDTNKVNASSFYFIASIGNERYFFNPHFAKTVARAGKDEHPAPPKEDSHIYLRTGRHLHNLSLYYEKGGTGKKGYRDVTSRCIFFQERNIAFSDYEWDAFTDVDSAKLNSRHKLTWQEPIGTTPTSSFIARFDGDHHMITDVSFKTSGDYAGLFGYVGKTAQIRNAVLCTDYTPVAEEIENDETALESLKNNYFVQRTIDPNKRSDKVYMGVLAGYSAGTISNCATAGYFLSGSDGTVHAYTGSVISLGGLVGMNTGSIENCAADSPKLRLSLYQTSAYAGGFVGNNEGSILNSYALGAIDVVEASDSEALVAGFAGLNHGQISSSYCATAIASSGFDTVVNGFAPAGGLVASCRYLNGGTYTYVGRMYAFNFDNSHASSGEPIRYEELKVNDPSDKNYVDDKHSFVHSQTKTLGSVERYPYRGIVTDKSGKLVHYGNWQDDVVLGNLGVFYWELEQESANSGYHMTYLGSRQEKNANGEWVPEFSGGSSLCNSHDDDGVITQYGYGVYVYAGHEQNATLSWSDITCSSDDLQTREGNAVTLQDLNLDGAHFNKEASQRLQEQMENTDTGTAEYRFFAFTTGLDNSGAKDYLYLDKPDGTAQNGTVTLTFTSAAAAAEAGEQSVTGTYVYEVSPFFANALSLKSATIKTADVGAPGDVRPKTLNVKAADERVIDCLAEPGRAKSGNSAKSENHYEVRSLQQLQYINWNAEQKKTNLLVDGSNYELFPYLQFTTVDLTKKQWQAREDAEGGNRACRYWLQTHDLKSVSGWNGTGDDHFSPIAGAATSSQAGNYSAILYAWFGGSFNGQSYTVRDISIQSESFYVGLFGATAGADIRNLILRGNSDEARIVRLTSENGTTGAYSIGGLAGLALNYAKDSTNQITEADKTITNCAISGYSIVDESKNQQGYGEVCIGGLVGVANVNLMNCSAVTEIEVKPEYDRRVANSGNYIRVGGLAGGLLDSITNCYTGGSISVGEDVLGQVYYSNKEKERIPMGTSAKAHWNKSTRIFLAGIAGCAFSSGLKNFGIVVSGEDKNTMKIHNSYTYMSFPDMTGTICSISMIASLADRHSLGMRPVIDNCYYLESSAHFGFEPAQYYYHQSSLKALFDDDEQLKQGMIDGDVRYLAQFLGKNDGESTPKDAPAGEPTQKSYNEMACLGLDNEPTGSFVSSLNGGDTGVWAPVTVKDNNGVPINGKYSFPKLSSLDGMNYPFPTVVTQNDLTFGVPVKVHYGDWPLRGAYWENGRDSMDIFSNMQTSGQHAGWAIKSFTLYVNSQQHPGVVSTSNITFDEPGYAEALSVVPDGTEGEYKKYKVTIKAQKDGFVTVNYKVSSQQAAAASFMLHITAEWEVKAEPRTDGAVFDPLTNTLRLDTNGSVQFQFIARPAAGEENSLLLENTAWNKPKPEPDVEGSLELSEGNEKGSLLTVSRASEDSTVLTVTASYTYANQQQQVYTRQLFITVMMPSAVGLSNAVAGTDGNLPADPTYKQILVGGPKGAGPVVDTPDPKPTPAYVSPMNFFLYTAKNDNYLQSAGNIESVSIGEHKYTPGQCGSQDAFYIEFDSSVKRSGSFSCLAGALYYVGEKPKQDVEITVNLQGGYSLKATIPHSSVTEAKLFLLTLNLGADTTTDPSVNRHFAIAQPGITSVPGYNSKDFSRPGKGWEIAGWYDSNDGAGREIIDASGKIVGDVNGAITDGVFHKEGKLTLYAKWKRQKEVWRPVYSIQPAEEGDAPNEYIIVSSKSPKMASVFYQGSTIETTGHGRGTYLSEDTVAISNESSNVSSKEYYDYSFIDADFPSCYRWKAEDIQLVANGVTYTAFGLVNSKHGCVFAENDDGIDGNTSRWGVVATPASNVRSRKVEGVETITDRVNLKFEISNANNNEKKGALRTISADVRYYPNTAHLIAGNGNGARIFLFGKGVKAESSFSFYPELKLMNGDELAASAIVTDTMQALTGSNYSQPTGQDGWTLFGWYDSTSKDAKKVLEPNGDVVNDSYDICNGRVVNGKLSLTDDLTLYAKWVKETTAFAETSSIGNRSEDVRFIIMEPAGAIAKKDNGAVRLLGISVSSNRFVNALGETINVIPNELGDSYDVNRLDNMTLVWTAEDRIQLAGRWLSLNASDNRLVLKGNEGEGAFWSWDSAKLSVGDSNVMYRQSDEKQNDGSWIAANKSDISPLRLFKGDTLVYEVSWEKK